MPGTAQHKLPAGALPAPDFPSRRWKKALLACGVAATAFYIALDAVAARRYRGYSYTGQTISELSAVGAPTRSLWNSAAPLYSLLMLAFGPGIWASAGTKRSLRVVGVIASSVGIIGLVAWPFAPMHRREELAAGGATFADTMHLVLSAVNSFLFVSGIALGALAMGTRFRAYSIVSLVAILVGGFSTAMQGSRVARNEQTPWIGVMERIAVLGSMVWFAVLGIVLRRAASNGAPRATRA